MCVDASCTFPRGVRRQSVSGRSREATSYCLDRSCVLAMLERRYVCTSERALPLNKPRKVQFECTDVQDFSSPAVHNSVGNSATQAGSDERCTRVPASRIQRVSRSGGYTRYSLLPEEGLMRRQHGFDRVSDDVLIIVVPTNEEPSHLS